MRKEAGIDRGNRKKLVQSCLTAVAFTSTVVAIGVIYLFKELENSPLLDQRLSEQYSLLKCYSQIASGELSSKSQCSQYAIHHMSLYPEYMAPTPEESLCLTSQGIFKFLKVEYPYQLDEIRLAESRAKRNCTSK